MVMTKAWAFGLVAVLALVPAAAAESKPAILFLADGEVPVGEGTLRPDWPDSNVSSLRMVLPAPTAELLVRFSTPEPAGERLLGPAFVAVWPDWPTASEGSLLRATLQVDGQAVANQTLPIHFDPANAPDPMAFIPPDPSDPQAAALHVVGQALPYIYTPGMLLYFGFIDVDVPEGAAVTVAFEIIPAGPVPLGSVLLKYDSLFTPSYVYLPWWVPDPDAPTPSSTPSRTSSRTPVPAPSPSPSDAPASVDGKESPGVPLIVALGALGAIAARRRR